MPRSLSEIASIEGVEDEIYENYGSEFLKLTKEYAVMRDDLEIALNAEEKKVGSLTKSKQILKMGTKAFKITKKNY